MDTFPKAHEKTSKNLHFCGLFQDCDSLCGGPCPTGIFLTVEDRVKLCTDSADRRSVILRIAEPGELIGLSATISGKPHEATAEALDLLQANFVPRDAFLELLRGNAEVAFTAAESLGDLPTGSYCRLPRAYRSATCSPFVGSRERPENGQRPSSNESHTHARRNRGNDRHIPRNRDSTPW